ncbi:transporter substrate-binding domain-containing protein [Bradyrhizobium sp. DASA03007]|uniref:transporter substrate-binding domain-containing protein n=1 Tax=unclassified Bradyrhizobium TaxID=2631580 RepID=UPI003F6FAEED
MRAASKLSLLILLLTVTAHSLPVAAHAEDAILSSIRKAGKIKVAMSSAPPYIIVSPTGEATGSSVDLQSMVLEEMGLPPLTPVLTGWEFMIPGLQAQQYEYIGAGFNITEARCKAVLLSTPYYAARTGLYVRPGNPKHLMSVADVAQRPDIKLSAIGTSAQLAYAVKQGVKSEQIMQVSDIQAGASTVIGGRADAFILGQFSITNPEQKGLEVVVDKQSPVDGSGAAFRKQDVGFRDEFNKHLISLIRSGVVQKLYQKYGIPNGDEQAQLLANFTKASDIVPSCE